jgi:hypothetical protein
MIFFPIDFVKIDIDKRIVKKEKTTGGENF